MNAEAGVTATCGCGFQARTNDSTSSINVIEKGLVHAKATGHILDIHGKIMPVREQQSWLSSRG